MSAHVDASDLLSRTGQELLVKSAQRAERATTSKPSTGSTRQPWGTAKQDLGGQLRSATMAHLRDVEGLIREVRVAVRLDADHVATSNQAMDRLLEAREAMDEAILLLGDWRDVEAS